uniref:Vacuolar protein sorting-associated protein 16 homolog n=1 Tax=Timema douglasi TaxID=61478 RepID=A0A7R8ZAW7_TIMDO|nr:unnamed protein product [Timema douglasi]
MPDVEGSSRILAHWACYKRVEQTDYLTIKCLPQDPMSLGSKPAELIQDIHPLVKQTQLDREQVARDIADKLGYAPGVSYSEIAKKAADCGRTQLAIKRGNTENVHCYLTLSCTNSPLLTELLLAWQYGECLPLPYFGLQLIDYEPRASLQVPLLLKLGEDIPSLVKAIDSGDTDLVYIVLLHLRDNMPMAEFQMTIRNYPLAQSLYLKYCRDHNIETLRDIYDQEDNHNAKAAFYLKESYEPKLGGHEAMGGKSLSPPSTSRGCRSSPGFQGRHPCRGRIAVGQAVDDVVCSQNSTTKAASLESAKQSYRSARNEFAATMCEEQQKLLKYQNTLEDKFRREFVGLSLHDTVHLLLMLHEVKLAEKLRAEYKVPDRRYWWLRILSLAALSEWSELDKFSKTKKSPIGYEPFVDVCLKYDKRTEAQKYLTRVKDDLKVKYYLKLGMLEEANNVATEHRDVQALLFVQSHCGTAEKTLSDQIDATIAQLTAKK